MQHLHPVLYFYFNDKNDNLPKERKSALDSIHHVSVKAITSNEKSKLSNNISISQKFEFQLQQLISIIDKPLGLSALTPDNCRQIHMWLSPGKPTRRAVTTMGPNHLVVDEDHMLGPSCQRYNWQTGRCGSIAFGGPPRRGKAPISNPRCLAEVSTCRKDFRR